MIIVISQGGVQNWAKVDYVICGNSNKRSLSIYVDYMLNYLYLTDVLLERMTNVFSKKMEKILQWSPLWIVFKGEIKIAHLLPEQSACQDEHFLKT